jgi:hypothetical protein
MRPSVSPLASALAVVALLAAGCADTIDAAGEAPDLGALRGVVVDQAIRPIAGATVLASSGGVERNATSDEDGLFNFTGLAAGLYVLTVSKAFYSTQQLTAQVHAGGEPPVVKVELVLETGILPFASATKWDGFIECSASIGNWCGIVNLYPCIALQQLGQPCSPTTSDRSFNFLKEFFLDLQRIPDWVQTEAYWESTQSVSESLAIRYAATNQSEWDQFSYGPVLASVHGTSPLVAGVPGPGAVDGGYLANSTTLKESGLGLDRGLTTELFHGAPNGLPREPEDLLCIPENPVANGCWSNSWAGFAANQRISIVYLAFYGYTPPEGWSLAASGEIPPPPA